MARKHVWGIPHTSDVCPLSSRPVCQCCGKPLKLATNTFWIHWNLDNAEARREEIAENALAYSQATYSEDGQVEQLKYWLGEFHGYCRDRDNIPIFCSGPCAIQFAGIHYRAGRRIELNGKLLSREPLGENISQE